MHILNLLRTDEDVAQGFPRANITSLIEALLHFAKVYNPLRFKIEN